jgi:hypothetical protein
MKNCESLAEFFGWLEEDYANEDVLFDGSISELSAFLEDDYHIEYHYDYTRKNVFYIILGHMLIKYGKYIFDDYLRLVNEAITEVAMNYDKLELTKEEQLEILNLAKQVKMNCLN